MNQQQKEKKNPFWASQTKASLLVPPLIFKGTFTNELLFIYIEIFCEAWHEKGLSVKESTVEDMKMAVSRARERTEAKKKELKLDGFVRDVCKQIYTYCV